MTVYKEFAGDKEALRRRIIEAAVGQFRQRGIRAVRMDDIVRDINISKRTLYQIFTDKEELLIACLEHEHAREKARQEAVAQRTDNVLEIVLLELEYLIESFKDTANEFYHDLTKYPSVVAFQKAHEQATHRQAVAFLEKGQRQGLFLSGIRLDLIFDLLITQIKTVIAQPPSSMRHDLRSIFSCIVITYFRGISTARGLAFIRDFMRAHPDIVPPGLNLDEA